MGINWEDTLGDTSYEDAVEIARKSLEKNDETERNLEEEKTEEKVLLAEVSKTTDYGYSEVDYDDVENDEVKVEGVYVKLYSGEGDIIEGTVGSWQDIGLTETSEGLPFIREDSTQFELNVKTGEIHMEDSTDFIFTSDYLVKNNVELIYEALKKYDTAIAEALDGKLTVIEGEAPMKFFAEKKETL